MTTPDRVIETMYNPANSQASRRLRANELDLFQHAARKDRVAAEYLKLLQNLPAGALELSAQGLLLKPRLQAKLDRLAELEKQHPDIGERAMDLQSARVKTRRAEKLLGLAPDAHNPYPLTGSKTCGPNPAL